MKIDVNLGANRDREEHVELTTREDGLIELYVSGATWEDEHQAYSGDQTGVTRVHMTKDQARTLSGILSTL